MKLSRCVVSLLVLGIAAPATAKNGRAVHTVQDSFATEHVRRGIKQGAQIRLGTSRDEFSMGADSSGFRVAAPAGEIASVAVSLSSDGGDEELVLVESDTRLHGAAAIAAVSGKTAALAVTVYDSANAKLVSFSGTLSADGTVSLEADAAEVICTKKGCTTTPTADVELVSAELVPAATGYELALDFGGADTHDVAYAELRTTPCDLTAEAGVCLYNGKAVVSEVYWNELSTIWEADLTVDHDGAIDARIRSYDRAGRLVEDTRTSVGLPWDDGADGVNVIPLEDGDAQTRMGFLYGTEGARVRNVRSLAVVSDGWSAGDALPTHANVELDDGSTISIPANSYQRKKKKEEDRIKKEADRQAVGGWTVDIDGRRLTVDGTRFSTTDLTSPLCAEGTCVMLVPYDDDGWEVVATQYRWDTSFPTDDVTITLTGYDAKGVKVNAHTFPIAFDTTQISVVFSTEVSFGADAVDTAFTGRLELTDESVGNNALAHGNFYSVLSVDSGGRVGVAGVGVDDVASANTPFAVLLQGERSSCGNDDDGFTAVPPLMATFGNGSGTRSASSQTSIKPQLL